MFDSKKFIDTVNEYQGSPVAFVFYDRFTKKFGPLNVSETINEVIYNSANYLKSVENSNISLDHIDVYIAGRAYVEKCVYALLHEPILLFNGSDYKEAYNTILEEVQNV